MTHQDEAAATDRLRRALLAFQSAQRLLLATERKLKDPSAERSETFPAPLGGHIERRMLHALHVPIERHVEIAATEVVEAFAVFSATGQVAPAEDRRLFTEAARVLAEAKA